MPAIKRKGAARLLKNTTESADGFNLEQTSLIANDRVRIVASSDGLGWPDLFAAVTDELPHAAIRRPISALWLVTAATPSDLWRTDATGSEKRVLPGGAVTITGIGDVVHDDLLVPRRALHLYLRQKVINEVCEELFNNAGQRNIDSHFSVTDAALQRMLAAVRAALNAGPAGSRLTLHYLSRALAAHLLEHYSSGGIRRAPMWNAVFSSQDTALISEYIDDHVASNMSIAELAKVVGMGRSQFLARFQATTNMTPRQFIILRRAAKARRLLVD
jgi:AraC family transcriptional regulator